jgi:hypothetical protein
MRPLDSRSLALTVAALLATSCAPPSRGCERQPTARRRELCQAIELRQRADWWGRWTPSLTWELDESDVTEIYCRHAITIADAPELKRMSHEQRDNLIGASAFELYQLSDPGVPDESSHNHPGHPGYRLKGGCQAPRE